MAEQEKIEDLNFETALLELETIVKSLEMGNGDLDNSITSYERGMMLKSYCEKKLKDAQARIEKISVSKDGIVSTEPFEAS